MAAGPWAYRHPVIAGAGCTWWLAILPVLAFAAPAPDDPEPGDRLGLVLVGLATFAVSLVVVAAAAGIALANADDKGLPLGRGATTAVRATLGATGVLCLVALGFGECLW